MKDKHRLVVAAWATSLLLLAFRASLSLAQPEKVEPEAVRAALAEIEGQYRWKDAPSRKDFSAAVEPKFVQWAELLARLSSTGQREEADRICAAIVALWNHLGSDLVRGDAFLRDRFSVGEYRVDAAQFFEPVPFSAGVDMIMKLYRFSLYKDGKVVARYYLEHSQLDGKPANSYYVLTFAEPGSHRQIRPYGRELPTYWTLKEVVVEHMKEQTRTFHRKGGRVNREPTDTRIEQEGIKMPSCAYESREGLDCPR